MLIFFAAILLFAFWGKPGITGNIITESFHEVNKQFTKPGVYLWKPDVNTTIKNLEIDGSIFGTGNVEISLIKGGKKTVLFKRTTKQEAINAGEYVELAEGTDIGLTISYSDGNWDTDNNGVASYDDGVDFKIEPFLFDSFNKKNLCTLWEVYSIEKEDYTSTCYGYDACCNFLGPSASLDDWDEDFVLSKGNQGSTAKNIVLSRIVFYNGTNTAYSNYDALPAQFVSGEITTKNLSQITTIFDSQNYLIKVDVGADTIFNFKGIKYSSGGEEKETTENETANESAAGNNSSQPKQATNIEKNFQKKSAEDPFMIEIADDYITGIRVTPQYYIETFETDIKIDSEGTLRRIRFYPEYSFDAVLFFKVPSSEKEAQVLCANETKKAVFLRSDATHDYYRSDITLKEIKLSLNEKTASEEKKEKSPPPFSALIYFVSSLFVALLIFLVWGVDTPLNEKIRHRIEIVVINNQLKKLRRFRRRF